MQHYPTANFEGRQGRKPLAIILHITNGPWAPTVRWFLDSGSQASAHDLIGKDGRHARFVDERDASWAANAISDVHPPTWTLYEPGANVNHYTLNVEHEGLPTEPLTSDAYAVSLALITDYCLRWGISPDDKHIIPHSAVYPLHNCPGPLFPFQRLYADLRDLVPQPAAGPVNTAQVHGAGFVNAAQEAACHEFAGGLYPVFVPDFALAKHAARYSYGLPLTGEFDWMFSDLGWRGQVWQADTARLVYCQLGHWGQIGSLTIPIIP